jgi:hypothetical protein
METGIFLAKRLDRWNHVDSIQQTLPCVKVAASLHHDVRVELFPEDWAGDSETSGEFPQRRGNSKALRAMRTKLEPHIPDPATVISIRKIY